MFKCSLIFVLLYFSLGVSGEWGDQRKPADFNRIPREQNKKSITSCLVKLKDLISDNEASNLDALKTMIERVYGLNRSFIKYRELYYKTQAGDKWRAEFYLTPESIWGKEKYKLKFFKAKEGNAYTEDSNPPIKEPILDKEAALRFAQYEDVEVDERWEGFFIPKEPVVKFKSKNFKLFELSADLNLSHTSLNCTIVSNHPFCQCSSAR